MKPENNHGSQIRLSTLLMTGREQKQNTIDENGRDSIRQLQVV